MIPPADSQGLASALVQISPLPRKVVSQAGTRYTAETSRPHSPVQLEGHSKRCRISTVTLKNCPKVSQKRPVSHKMEYRYLYSTLVLLASWASMPSVRSAAVQHYQLANAWHCRASTPAAAVPYCGLPFAATNSYGEHLPECWFDPSLC